MTKRRDGDGLTYSEAGVDIAAGEKAVELIKEHVRSTFRPEVVGDIGGFGGLFSLAKLRYRDPLLVSSTDGVGTKSLIAAQVGRFDTIGEDVVAMSVDDIAAHGAEPLFFLDYISVGKVVPEHIDEIVKGVARGCQKAGCALLGGEISEHPGVMVEGEFDLVGFAVGVVERSALLPSGVKAGDRIIGLASPGLRCNGYSLARQAFTAAGSAARRTGVARRAPFAGRRAAHAERDLRTGDGALAPPRRGARLLPRHRRRHPRQPRAVLPHDCDAVVERGRWEEPRIFSMIQQVADVSDDEMEHVFNLGVGMLAVIAESDVYRAIDGARAAGQDAWLVGEIVDGHGHVAIERTD